MHIMSWWPSVVLIFTNDTRITLGTELKLDEPLPGVRHHMDTVCRHVLLSTHMYSGLLWLKIGHLVTHLDTSLIFGTEVHYDQKKILARFNLKKMAAILDFGGHL